MIECAPFFFRERPNHQSLINIPSHPDAMTIIGRIVRASRPFRVISSLSKTLNPPSRKVSSARLLCGWPTENQYNYNASEIQRLKSVPESSELNFMLPALLAGFLGVEGLRMANADSDNSAAARPLPSESPASYMDLAEIARKERMRIEELLKSKGLPAGSYPRFNVAIKGQKVTVKFQIPPSCEIPKLIASLVSHLGLKVEQQGGGSDMSLRAWDSAISWQLTLTGPAKEKETSNEEEGDLCVLLFGSLVSSDRAELEFIKRGSLSAKELDAFVWALQLAGGMMRQYNTSEKPSSDKLVANLESMGVRVYGLDDSYLYSSTGEISWENIAGYHQQKQQIEDTIMLALQSPEVYDEIARGTRRKFESNRPRAVLFEGPPGTGKTSSARVIANQAGVPLLYVPLEVVMSKYYGESERLLAKVFSLADELSTGAIIFLDEIDSFAVARDGEMHEATRRVLSVLLRQIDGFEQDKKVVVIAATNRKQDLDPALISRFDSLITFGLPDHSTRQEIASQYAKHLTRSELDELAALMEEMSGRDIREVCQQAERTWASKIIRGKASRDGEQGLLPPLEEYIQSAVNRQKGLSSISDPKPLALSRTGSKRSRLVVD